MVQHENLTQMCSIVSGGKSSWRSGCFLTTAFGVTCTDVPTALSLPKSTENLRCLWGGVTRVEMKSLDTIHIVGERTLSETSRVWMGPKAHTFNMNERNRILDMAFLNF